MPYIMLTIRFPPGTMSYTIQVIQIINLCICPEIYLVYTINWARKAWELSVRSAEQLRAKDGIERCNNSTVRLILILSDWRDRKGRFLIPYVQVRRDVSGRLPYRQSDRIGIFLLFLSIPDGSFLKTTSCPSRGFQEVLLRCDEQQQRQQ